MEQVAVHKHYDICISFFPGEGFMLHLIHKVATYKRVSLANRSPLALLATVRKAPVPSVLIKAPLKNIVLVTQPA